ncbi:MAG: hypothetical protein P8X96_21015, partial [Desulfobacteraceae bacterium]
REYLIVDYTIPPVTQRLRDQSVRLQIDDRRENPKIMTPTAAAKFQDFNDRYSLAWITSDKGRILAGEHDLAALFKKAFEKRLALAGAIATPANSVQDPLLAIALDAFTIDLKGQKWVAEVSYTATLTQEGHPVTKEQVRGKAERVRIIGRKGADMVISDIFTEVVNRLNLEALFRKAELIP